MTILELSNVFDMPLVIAGFIVIVVTVVSLLIAKIWKKKIISAAANQRPPSSASLLSIGLQKHQTFLKDISLRIMEDRKHIEKSLTVDYSTFQEHVLKKLEDIQPSVHEIMHLSLQEKYSIQEEQAKEICKTLDAVERDFLTLKSQLQHVSLVLANPVQKSFQELSSSNVDTVPTESRGTEDGNQRLQGEVYRSELVTCILTVTKENFAKLVSENKARGKEMIRTIERFREQSQKDIQKEITLFSSVVNESEHDDRNNNANFSLIEEVEKLEKNLLETFIFLNRQRFDMENMKKTLTYFTKKFLYAAAKFDAYWQQSKASYSSASQRLKEGEVFWSSVIEKMDNSTYCLLQQSRNLTSIIADLDNILKMEGHNAEFFPIFKKSENSTNLNSEDRDVSWIQNIDQVNQKLQDLLAVCENNSEKTTNLTQMSQNLGNFCNLISSIAEGYSALFSFILASVEKSKIKNQQFVGLEKSGQNFCNTEAHDDSNNMRLIEKGDNFVIDDNLWNDVRQELNSELPNLDIDDLRLILKYPLFLKYLENCGSIRREDKMDVVDSAANSVCNETYENDRWGSIPSESSLGDITRDHLVQNSEESDKASEVNSDELDE